MSPHIAANWFPVNDHPIDIASYKLSFTVPEAYQAVANGKLLEQSLDGGWSTWVWDAQDPMASYLIGVAITQLSIREYEENGISYLDAVQESLLQDTSFEPVTGVQFIASGEGNLLYKRLSRVISVPESGAKIDFKVQGETEFNFDYFFIEARTAGGNDWTTLADVNGRAQQNVLRNCEAMLVAFPPLENYLTVEDGLCRPDGETGEWWGFTGEFEGVESWSIDISAWSGKEIEVSFSYVTDTIVSEVGVFIDDVVVSTGEGDTSFEIDEDPLDGWQASNPLDPEEAIAWSNSGLVTVPGVGQNAFSSLSRQPDIIAFLEEIAGEYPFKIAGGIVAFGGGGALETQTRPVYADSVFVDENTSIVVHELAHQWFGNILTVNAWQHIWLNEGFATYTEWMWLEAEGGQSAEEQFQQLVNSELCSQGFIDWSVPISNPGPARLFAGEVYVRGAMVLHVLRQKIGDSLFVSLLKRWVEENHGKSVTTDQFIVLAETVSGQDLDDVFDAWLFSTEKPDTSSYCSGEVLSKPNSSFEIKTKQHFLRFHRPEKYLFLKNKK